MERFVVNERLKRLEPTETLCRFCNKRHSDKMDRNSFTPLFSVEDRTNIIVYSSVKFKKILVGIPRCNQCFVIHKQSSFNSWVVSLLVGIILGYLGFEFLGLYGILSLIVCFILTLIAPMFISDMFVKRNGILTEKEGAMKDPLIQDLVISGWSMNQPSAR